MKLRNSNALLLLMAVGLIGTATPHHAHATEERSQGVDLAWCQGNMGLYGRNEDEFAICQVGGFNGANYYDEHTYNSQVANANQLHKRAHSYIWYQVGGNSQLGIDTVNHFLPKIKTPKGSIVALDYEAGASGNVRNNTNAILSGMRVIANNGYVPMLYSYKGYLEQYVDVNQINQVFNNKIWIAGYQPNNAWFPNYNYFPSMNGVALWQFTDKYGGKSLDGDVDLLKITNCGYNSQNQPLKPVTPPTVPNNNSNNSNNFSYYQNGTFTVDVNSLNVRTAPRLNSTITGQYHFGESLNYYYVTVVNNYVWLAYHSYSGVRYICAGILGGTSYGTRTTNRYYIVQSGDNLSKIATKFNTTVNQLVVKNHLTNPNYLQIGQKILL